MIVSSRERQRRLIQTKAYYKLFYSIWKEAFHKPLKLRAAKKSVPSVYIIDKTCFDECFFFHIITGKIYFLQKYSVTQSFGFCIIWNKCFVICINLQNNTSMLLILKVRNKSSTSQIFSRKSFFYTLSFCEYPHFSFIASSLEACFLLSNCYDVYLYIQITSNKKWTKASDT